jgi:hypothetical protein
MAIFALDAEKSGFEQKLIPILGKSCSFAQKGAVILYSQKAGSEAINKPE